MNSRTRPDRPLSLPAALLLILCLITGQSAAAVHTGLPVSSTGENAHHHHADQTPTEYHLKAPTDHHDHHASGGVECPCLLCAGSALANTSDTPCLAAAHIPALSAAAHNGASTAIAWLRPPLRAPPLAV